VQQLTRFQLTVHRTICLRYSRASCFITPVTVKSEDFAFSKKMFVVMKTRPKPRTKKFDDTFVSDRL